MFFISFYLPLSIIINQLERGGTEIPSLYSIWTDGDICLGGSGMQDGGMIGLWKPRGTGTPWFMQFPGIIPAGWEVHECSVYSLYKPLFSHR